MHKLEITGTTPEDLFMNAVRMLSVLLKGGAQTTAAPVEHEVEPATAGDGHHYGEKRSEPKEDEKITVLPPEKPKRGTRAKAADKLVPDEIPDLTGGKTIEHKALSLDDDIRPRLRAIQKAHTERGHDMATCVAFIQQLYGPFGIAKAEQLKPDQFSEFMEASVGYLTGEAQCF